MNTDEKRIRIAIACGWSGFNPDNIPNCIQYTAKGPSGKWGLIPDYLNDLNAMNNAEKILFGNDKWMERYGREIHMRAYLHDMPNFHLQADERAEAFGKTLNLW